MLVWIFHLPVFLCLFFVFANEKDIIEGKVKRGRNSFFFSFFPPCLLAVIQQMPIKAPRGGFVADVVIIKTAFLWMRWEVPPPRPMVKAPSPSSGQLRGRREQLKGWRRVVLGKTEQRRHLNRKPLRMATLRGFVKQSCWLTRHTVVCSFCDYFIHAFKENCMSGGVLSVGI